MRLLGKYFLKLLRFCNFRQIFMCLFVYFSKFLVDKSKVSQFFKMYGQQIEIYDFSVKKVAFSSFPRIRETFDVALVAESFIK